MRNPRMVIRQGRLGIYYRCQDKESWHYVVAVFVRLTVQRAVLFQAFIAAGASGEQFSVYATYGPVVFERRGATRNIRLGL